MERGDIKQGAALGFLAGYVDTLGFVGLFGLFTAHVTGNFVLIGRALIEPTQAIAIKLMVFPVFILFVALARLAILHWDRNGSKTLRNSFLFQLFMMLATVLCAWQAAPVVEASAPLTLLTGSLCAGAMAVQNAYGKLLLGKAAATTVMTGNVTTLVIELVDSLRGDQEAIGRCKKLTWPVLGFTAGCMSGGIAFVLTGFHGLLLPCAMLVWLAAAARD
ncbi:YoaK family protein [Duganella sp.]|uniref:YoaK family protein n=1 Tax=Duganella sp. TaxID=1904440 RepID=UPI0031E03A9F